MCLNTSEELKAWSHVSRTYHFQLSRITKVWCLFSVHLVFFQKFFVWLRLFGWLNAILSGFGEKTVRCYLPAEEMLWMGKAQAKHVDWTGAARHWLASPDLRWDPRICVFGKFSVDVSAYALGTRFNVEAKQRQSSNEEGSVLGGGICKEGIALDVDTLQVWWSWWCWCQRCGNSSPSREF